LDRALLDLVASSARPRLASVQDQGDLFRRRLPVLPAQDPSRAELDVGGQQL
jgi:hypothetical protein